MSVNMYDAWDCGDRPAIRAQLKQREDIIRMAREAGFETDCGPLLPESASIKVGGLYVGVQPLLERFAALVAAAERDHLLSTEIHSCHANCQRFACVQTRKAMEVEREACAKVCENIYTGDEGAGDWPTPEMCAAAIRARGQA